MRSMVHVLQKTMIQNNFIIIKVYENSLYEALPVSIIYLLKNTPILQLLLLLPPLRSLQFIKHDMSQIVLMFLEKGSQKGAVRCA